VKPTFSHEFSDTLLNLFCLPLDSLRELLLGAGWFFWFGFFATADEFCLRPKSQQNRKKLNARNSRSKWELRITKSSTKLKSSTSHWSALLRLYVSEATHCLKSDDLRLVLLSHSVEDSTIFGPKKYDFQMAFNPKSVPHFQIFRCGTSGTTRDRPTNPQVYPCVCVCVCVPVIADLPVGDNYHDHAGIRLLFTLKNLAIRTIIPEDSANDTAFQEWIDAPPGFPHEGLFTSPPHSGFAFFHLDDPSLQSVFTIQNPCS